MPGVVSLTAVQLADGGAGDIYIDLPTAANPNGEFRRQLAE